MKKIFLLFFIVIALSGCEEEEKAKNVIFFNDLVVTLQDKGYEIEDANKCDDNIKEDTGSMSCFLINGDNNRIGLVTLKDSDTISVSHKTHDLESNILIANIISDLTDSAYNNSNKYKDDNLSITIAEPETKDQNDYYSVIDVTIK